MKGEARGVACARAQKTLPSVGSNFDGSRFFAHPNPFFLSSRSDRPFSPPKTNMAPISFLLIASLASCANALVMVRAA